MKTFLLIIILILSFNVRPAFEHFASNAVHTLNANVALSQSEKDAANYAVFAASYRVPFHSETEQQIFTRGKEWMPISKLECAIGYT